MKTLQLEQLAVMGKAEEPSIVSSRMQLVFSTLEVWHSTQKNLHHLTQLCNFIYVDGIYFSYSILKI